MRSLPPTTDHLEAKMQSIFLSYKWSLSSRAKIKFSAWNHRRGHQHSKNDMTLSKVIEFIDVGWPQCTSERSWYHYISANDGYYSATCTSPMTCTTSCRYAYHQQKTPSSQVTGVETGGVLKFGNRSSSLGDLRRGPLPPPPPPQLDVLLTRPQRGEG